MLLEMLESRLLLAVGGVNTNLWIRFGDNMTATKLASKAMSELKDGQHLDYADNKGEHIYDSASQAKTEGTSPTTGGDFAASTEMNASVTNFDGRHLCKADGNALLEWFVDVVPLKDLPDIVSKSAIGVGGLEVPLLYTVAVDVQATSSADFNMNIWGSTKGEATLWTVGALGGTTVVHDMLLHGDTRYDIGWDARTDYGKTTIRYVPFLWRSSYLYFYFQAFSEVLVMPPIGGAGNAQAKARVDPQVEFDQAAFDQEAASLGFPSFNLADYFRLSAGQAPNAVSPNVNVSKPDLSNASDTGTSNTDNITGDRTPTFTGTVEDMFGSLGMPKATLAVLYVDGVQTTQAAIKNGTYTLTSSALDAGEHSVMVAAGMSQDYLSMPSDPLLITIDTSLPDGTDGKAGTPGPVTIPGGDLTLGSGGVKAVTFTDDSGSSATFKLTNASAAVHFEGVNLVQHVANSGTTMTGTGVKLSSITLAGDASTAVLSFSVRPGQGGNGHVELGGLTCTGVMGSIQGRNVDLGGDIVLGGLAGSLLLGDVVGGQRIITLGGSPTDKGASVSLGNVADLQIVSGAPIKSLSVGGWTDSADDDAVIAPSLSKLSCAGDFEPGLKLAAPGGATSMTVLGLTRIGGAITGGTWDITGGTDSITAGRIDAAFKATVTGAVKAMTVTGSVGGTLEALSIGNFKIGGGLDGASITLTRAPLGQDDKTKALGSLTVGGTMNDSSLDSQGHVGKVSSLGNVTSATVNVAGDISSIIAKSWQGGSITAQSLSSMTVSGDFGADLKILGTSSDATGKTLGAVTIKGSVAPSVWDLTGPVGALIVSGTVGAAGQPWVLRNSTAIASLIFGDVIDGQVQGAANIGAVKATRWQAGSLSANTVTSISTTGAAATKTAAAIPGDFAADLSLAGVGVTPKMKTLGSASIKGNVGASIWDLMGPVGTLAITGTVGTVAQPWQVVHPTYLGGLTLGDVTNATVSVSGESSAIKAKRWLAGSIQAARVASITMAGAAATLTAPAVSGDFAADVTVTGAGKTTLTMAVAGWLDGAAIASPNGPLGSIALGGIRNSAITAGDDLTQTLLSGLTVKGIKGQAFSFINSTVSAWTLGTISVKTVQTGNGSQAHGITGHRITTSYTRDGKRLAGPTAGPKVVEQVDDFLVELV